MITNAERLAMAKEIVYGQKGVFWGSTLLMGLSIGLLQSISMFLLATDVALLGVLGYLAAILLAIAIQVNAVQLINNMQTRTATFSDFFSMENLGKKVKITLVKIVFIFLWSLIPFGGIIAAYRYALSEKLYFLNPYVSGNELLDLSKACMRGYKMGLFLSDLWQAIKLMFFGVITLYIAWIWLLPRYAVQRSLYLDDILSQSRPRMSTIT